MCRWERAELVPVLRKLGGVNLVDKLRRIAAPEPPTRHTAGNPADGNPAPGRLAGAFADEAQPAPGSVEVPGEEAAGPGGAFWIRTERFPLSETHGDLTLSAVADTPLKTLAGLARDPALFHLDMRRAVFFDTETTSLGGGVGTYIFLFGAGFFEDDHFVVEQYFLREVTEERALLEAVTSRLKQFDLAVSFHGKGFDVPRMQGRCTFHRVTPAMPASHLDLCLVGRSLYRGAFRDCRLQTFEKEIVGFRRADDLPGALCPQAFFDHLQGDSTLIPRVFEHNLYDILTLPAIAACFAREMEAPSHPVVLANLGSFYESQGADQRAREKYQQALEGLRGGPHPYLPRALERLALLERRAGRHAESASLLLERKDLPPCSLEALEDLAKYYEHRLRDFRSAEAATLEARSRLITGKIAVDHGTRFRWIQSLDHRLARLRRRSAANGSPSSASR